MPIEIIKEHSSSPQPITITLNSGAATDGPSIPKPTDGQSQTLSNHYVEFHQHYSDLAGQNDVETFLFTSESVSEGHPGTVKLNCNRIKTFFDFSTFQLFRQIVRSSQ